MEQEATTPPIPLSPSLQAGVVLEPAAFAKITSALDKKIRWYILVACCLASAAKLLEPPIWVFNPPQDIPFEAAWSNYRLFASFAALLTVIFLLAGGILGDLYGRRRVLLIGLSGYLAGNLLVMTYPDLQWHIATRSIAVAFGAAAIPLSLAMLYITFQDRTMAIAIAIYTISNTLASQLAWVQGEYLARVAGWRAPYVLPTIVALLAIIAVTRVLPETVAGTRRLLDTIVYAGWTLIALATFFILIGWPFDEDSRWLSVVGAALLVGGIGTGLVIWWNWRTRNHPKVQRSFRLRDLMALIITGVILNFALIAYGVRTYNYFQVDQGFSDPVALLAEAPILFGTIAGVLLIVRSVRKLQARLVIAGGLLVMALSIAVTALLPTGSSYLLYVIPLFVFGIGYLVAVTVWISAFLRTAVDGYYGLNSAINKGASLLGAAIGAAVAGNLLSVFGMNYYRDALSQLNLTKADLDAALATFQQALRANPADASEMVSELKGALSASYLPAYASAYDSILYIVAALCALSAIIILLGLRRTIRAEAANATEKLKEENEKDETENEEAEKEG